MLISSQLSNHEREEKQHTFAPGPPMKNPPQTASELSRTSSSQHPHVRQHLLQLAFPLAPPPPHLSQPVAPLLFAIPLLMHFYSIWLLCVFGVFFVPYCCCFVFSLFLCGSLEGLKWAPTKKMWFYVNDEYDYHCCCLLL